MQRHAITPTTFGLWAMNDSRFVFDLRSGRQCLGKTMRRIYEFMAKVEVELEARRQRLEKTAASGDPPA